MLSAYKNTAYVLLGGALCKAWQLIFSCFSLCALVKRCLCFLIEFWLTSAASRQNSSEQNVLRCKPGADTQCWLLGVNFFGIKGNVKAFPQFCVLAVLILVMT